MADRAKLLRRASDLFDWIGAGKLQVRIEQTFALVGADQARRYLEGPKTKGKIVLIP